jgi:tetratricopeptide (TPR) repeat protein
MLGETEFYFNDTKKAVENYIKALKLSKNENISVLAELRLSEALLLTLRFRDALQHLERVLWITTNLNHEHIKSLVMEDVARIYLHILPPTSASMFLRFSMEDFLNGPVNQSYSYLYLLGLWYLKLGKTREGMQLLKLEIAREIGRGNRFKANNIALALVSELAKSGLLQEAGEILKNIKTRSPFLLNRKTLLETIMKLIQGKVLEFDLKTIEKMAEKNALNMLNFLELTENIKSPQLSALRERFNKDLVDLFSALRDIDLEGRL